MGTVTADPYWNHNTHYHRWLLRRIPPSARTALDIGCGDGLLATKLARRCDTVLGVDTDAEVLTRAAPDAAVTYRHGDFRTLPGSFDVVTASPACTTSRCTRASPPCAGSSRRAVPCSSSDCGG